MLVGIGPTYTFSEDERNSRDDCLAFFVAMDCLNDPQGSCMAPGNCLVSILPPAFFNQALGKEESIWESIPAFHGKRRLVLGAMVLIFWSDG